MLGYVPPAKLKKMLLKNFNANKIDCVEGILSGNTCYFIRQLLKYTSRTEMRLSHQKLVYCQIIFCGKNLIIFTAFQYSSFRYLVMEVLLHQNIRYTWKVNDKRFLECLQPVCGSRGPPRHLQIRQQPATIFMVNK